MKQFRFDVKTIQTQKKRIGFRLPPENTDVFVLIIEPLENEKIEDFRGND